MHLLAIKNNIDKIFPNRQTLTKQNVLAFQPPPVHTANLCALGCNIGLLAANMVTSERQNSAILSPLGHQPHDSPAEGTAILASGLRHYP